MAGEPYGAGHIHDTYRVAYERCRGIRRYIVQRINRGVFPRPEPMMENIQRVCEHLRVKRVLAGPGPTRPTWLGPVPALDGRSFWIDAAGEYWRAYHYVADSYSCDRPREPRQAAQAGAAAARFQHDLADLPGPRLHLTLPHFHHTPRRLAALKASLAADALGRAGACRREIDFALAREQLAGRVVEGLARGTLPERIVHNDTKFNNVRFDRRTHAAICLVDLDTVMPGSVLYDFGDLVRTTVNPAAEDAADLRQAVCRMDMFQALCRGYLGVAGYFLTQNETVLLADAGPLITLELGIRFLSDYLDGDRYFKTGHETHNLMRCRTQFHLVAEMERRADEMAGIVERSLKSAR